MKRGRRIRIVAKWTGVCLICVLGAIWATSLYRCSTFIAHSPANAYYGVTATGGALAIDYVPPIRVVADRQGNIIPLRFTGSETWNVQWRTQPNFMYFTWKPEWRRRTHSKYPGVSPLSLVAPLWMPLAAVALPTAWLFWPAHLWRRVLPGHCRCGYSLAGLTREAACPECGFPTGK